jgi:hypothetical protein
VRSPDQLCDTAPENVKVTQIESEKLAEFLMILNDGIKSRG